MSASRSAAALGLRAARRAKSSRTCRARRAGRRTSWRAISCRPTSSTARVCASVSPTALRRCAGCRTPTRKSMPRTTFTRCALEFNVPLLKDVPGFQDLSTNLAGRRAKYSNFDAGDSWKIGLNWQIVDSVRFRSHPCRRTSARRTSTICTSPPALPRRDSRTGSRAAATRAAPRHARQSGPDAGNGEDDHGGHRADAELHSALQLRGRLLRDQVDERDHQHHAIRTTPSRGCAWPARRRTTRRSARWRSGRSRIRPIPTT